MLAAVALLCLLFQLRMPSKAVAESDYLAVAKIVEAEGQAGDVVLLYPWWTERARVYLPERIPIVGYLTSDSDDLDRYGRIWLLAEPNQPRADLDGFLKGFGLKRVAAAPPRVFGNLTLQLFENQRHRPVAIDFGQLLPAAHVFLESPDGRRADCQFDGQGHRCPNSTEVVWEWHEILFAPHRCVRFWPAAGANRIVAEFTAPAPAATLSLRAGMVWDRGFFHSSDLTATDVGLEVNGQPVAAMSIPVGKEGEQRLEAGAINAGDVVRVWSRAQNAHYRELCFELYGMEK